jgi:hypothetical protein
LRNTALDGVTLSKYQILVHVVRAVVAFVLRMVVIGGSGLESNIVGIRCRVDDFGAGWIVDVNRHLFLVEIIINKF